MLSDAELAPVAPLQSGPVTDLSTTIAAAANVVAQAADRTAARRSASQAQQDAAKAQQDADAAKKRLFGSVATAGNVPAWFWGIVAVTGLGLGIAYITTHSKRHR